MRHTSRPAAAPGMGVEAPPAVAPGRKMGPATATMVGRGLAAPPDATLGRERGTSSPEPGKEMEPLSSMQTTPPPPWLADMSPWFGDAPPVPLLPPSIPCLRSISPYPMRHGKGKSRAWGVGWNHDHCWRSSLKQ
jgi:hypothetical protein